MVPVPRIITSPSLNFANDGNINNSNNNNNRHRRMRSQDDSVLPSSSKTHNTNTFTTGSSKSSSTTPSSTLAGLLSPASSFSLSSSKSASSSSLSSFPFLRYHGNGQENSFSSPIGGKKDESIGGGGGGGLGNHLHSPQTLFSEGLKRIRSSSHRRDRDREKIGREEKNEEMIKKGLESHTAVIGATKSTTTNADGNILTPPTTTSASASGSARNSEQQDHQRFLRPLSPHSQSLLSPVASIGGGGKRRRSWSPLPGSRASMRRNKEKERESDNDSAVVQSGEGNGNGNGRRKMAIGGRRNKSRNRRMMFFTTTSEGEDDGSEEEEEEERGEVKGKSKSLDFDSITISPVPFPSTFTSGSAVPARITVSNVSAVSPLDAENDNIRQMDVEDEVIDQKGETIDVKEKEEDGEDEEEIEEGASPPRTWIGIRDMREGGCMTPASFPNYEGHSQDDSQHSTSGLTPSICSFSSNNTGTTNLTRAKSLSSTSNHHPHHHHRSHHYDRRSDSGYASDVSGGSISILTTPSSVRMDPAQLPTPSSPSLSPSGSIRSSSNGKRPAFRRSFSEDLITSSSIAPGPTIIGSSSASTSTPSSSSSSSSLSFNTSILPFPSSFLLTPRSSSSQRRSRDHRNNSSKRGRAHQSEDSTLPLTLAEENEEEEEEEKQPGQRKEQEQLGLQSPISPTASHSHSHGRGTKSSKELETEVETRLMEMKKNFGRGGNGDDSTNNKVNDNDTSTSTTTASNAKTLPRSSLSSNPSARSSMDTSGGNVAGSESSSRRSSLSMKRGGGFEEFTRWGFFGGAGIVGRGRSLDRLRTDFGNERRGSSGIEDGRSSSPMGLIIRGDGKGSLKKKNSHGRRGGSEGSGIGIGIGIGELEEEILAEEAGTDVEIEKRRDGGTGLNLGMGAGRANTDGNHGMGTNMGSGSMGMGIVAKLFGRRMRRGVSKTSASLGLAPLSSPVSFSAPVTPMSMSPLSPQTSFNGETSTAAPMLPVVEGSSNDGDDVEAFPLPLERKDSLDREGRELSVGKTDNQTQPSEEPAEHINVSMSTPQKGKDRPERSIMTTPNSSERVRVPSMSSIPEIPTPSSSIAPSPQRTPEEEKDLQLGPMQESPTLFRRPSGRSGNEADRSEDGGDDEDEEEDDVLPELASSPIVSRIQARKDKGQAPPSIPLRIQIARSDSPISPESNPSANPFAPPSSSSVSTLTSTTPPKTSMSPSTGRVSPSPSKGNNPNRTKRFQPATMPSPPSPRPNKTRPRLSSPDHTAGRGGRTGGGRFNIHKSPSSGGGSGSSARSSFSSPRSSFDGLTSPLSSPGLEPARLFDSSKITRLYGLGENSHVGTEHARGDVIKEEDEGEDGRDGGQESEVNLSESGSELGSRGETPIPPELEEPHHFQLGIIEESDDEELEEVDLSSDSAASSPSTSSTNSWSSGGRLGKLGRYGQRKRRMTPRISRAPCLADVEEGMEDNNDGTGMGKTGLPTMPSRGSKAWAGKIIEEEEEDFSVSSSEGSYLADRMGGFKDRIMNSLHGDLKTKQERIDSALGLDMDLMDEQHRHLDRNTVAKLTHQNISQHNLAQTNENGDDLTQSLDAMPSIPSLSDAFYLELEEPEEPNIDAETMTLTGFRNGGSSAEDLRMEAGRSSDTLKLCHS